MELIPFRRELFLPASEIRGSPLGRKQQLATFPADFSIGFIFLGENRREDCKWYKQDAKYPDHDHMNTGDGGAMFYHSWKCFTNCKVLF